MISAQAVGSLLYVLEKSPAMTTNSSHLQLHAKLLVQVSLPSSPPSTTLNL